MTTKAPMLDIAVCQMTSTDDVEANTREIERVLNSIEGTEGLDAVFFPENALYFRVKDDGPRRGITPQDPSLERLSRWSVGRGVALHIGSVPLLENGKVYAASVFLTPDGKISPVYNKIHLFDVDVAGQKPVRESDVFTHGKAPSMITLKGWKLGSSICYDIRFSELFSRYAREDVDAILVPAAFLTTTGKAHWEILVRARAIESQAYVVAAAQGGMHRGTSGGTRETHGHSMVVDPWGQVLAECREEGSGSWILRAQLSQERIEAVRRQIPMKNHRSLA